MCMCGVEIIREKRERSEGSTGDAVDCALRCTGGARAACAEKAYLRARQVAWRGGHI